MCLMINKYTKNTKIINVSFETIKIHLMSVSLDMIGIIDMITDYVNCNSNYNIQLNSLILLGNIWINNFHQLWLTSQHAFITINNELCTIVMWFIKVLTKRIWMLLYTHALYKVSHSQVNNSDNINDLFCIL